MVHHGADNNETILGPARCLTKKSLCYKQNITYLKHACYNLGVYAFQHFEYNPFRNTSQLRKLNYWDTSVIISHSANHKHRLKHTRHIAREPLVESWLFPTHTSVQKVCLNIMVKL